MWEKYSSKLPTLQLLPLCKQAAEHFGKERPLAVVCFQVTALERRGSAVPCIEMLCDTDLTGWKKDVFQLGSH